MDKCPRCGKLKPCDCAEKDMSRKHNVQSAMQKNDDDLSAANNKASEYDSHTGYHRKQ